MMLDRMAWHDITLHYIILLYLDGDKLGLRDEARLSDRRERAVEHLSLECNTMQYNVM